MENNLENEIANSEAKEKLKKRPYVTLSDEQVQTEINKHRALLNDTLISDDEKARLFEKMEGYENELKNRR